MKSLRSRSEEGLYIWSLYILNMESLSLSLGTLKSLELLSRSYKKKERERRRKIKERTNFCTGRMSIARYDR